MELLANVLSLEFQYQMPESAKQLVATGFQYNIFEWEKQLVASGALHDDGKVDVQLFIAASSTSSTLSDPDTIVMPEAGPQSLAPTSGAVSQTAVVEADTSKISTTLSTMSSDVQLLLPTCEVIAGAVVSVAPEGRLQSGKVSQTAVVTTTSGDVPLPVSGPEVTGGPVVSVASKHYEIREKLGRGAGGS
eukprot:4831144-Amphidinium_carterae.1